MTNARNETCRNIPLTFLRVAHVFPAKPICAGLLGTRPSQEAMESCETLLIVGTSFPYIEFYPKPGEAKAIQIDLDPKRIGLRYPIDVGLIGDSARSLAEVNK